VHGFDMRVPDDVVEHLPDDKIPVAAAGIRKIAERIGIEWD
jgi:hypothetical protein